MKTSSIAWIVVPTLVSLGITWSPAIAEAEPLFGNRQSFWQAQLGARSTLLKDPGFDPFASDDLLTQVSVGVARTVWTDGAVSFAPGVIWDYGQRDGTARGQSTSLSVHRLAVALEGRYHFLPWAYGLVRLTPGALHQSIELADAMAPYVASHWAFAFDASAGAAFLLGPERDGSGPGPHWWVAAEGGYSYAGSTALRLHSDLAEGDPRRTGDLDLGTLALRGGFVRIYGSVTY